MITHDEFQRALIIVREYVSQFNKETEKVEKTISNLEKTPILDWVREKENSIKKQTSVHSRLFNALRCLYHSDYFQVEFIEDVAENDLRKIRNSGQKTFELFIKLKSNK